MCGSGNHLEDRLDAEMRNGYVAEGQEICLDCGRVNCICDEGGDN
jgi:hypothetical protein